MLDFIEKPSAASAVGAEAKVLWLSRYPAFPAPLSETRTCLQNTTRTKVTFLVMKN